MNRGRLIGSIVTVLAVVASLLVLMVGFGRGPRLGLDLRGGISVILTPVSVEGTEIPEDVLNETVEIIRSRVDSLGVAEPEIAPQGGDIVVQLPGLEDRERALEIIGQTAKLSFRPVLESFTPGTPQYDQVGPDCGGDLSAIPTLPEPSVSPSEPDASPASPEASPAGSPTEEGSPAAAGTFVVAAGEGDTTEAPTPSPEATGSPSPSPSATGDPADDQTGQLADDEEAVLCGEPLPDDPSTPDVDESAFPPTKYRVGPAALGGTDVADALAVTEQVGQAAVSNNWVVQLDLTGEGGNRFAAITGQLACERDQGAPSGGRMAIVLDEVVRSAPSMNPEVACGTGIVGGQAIITVGGEEQEARDLALVLRTGALPITLEPSTAFNVSPTLGAESLRAGIIAGLIGLALVALYLVSFYRWLGAIAFVELLVFAVVVVGLITLLGEVGFTLTLAGVAGVIVSVGIAADSSILYFERIRDELSAGKTVRTSVVRAFTPAFRTNLTGNTVTIAAAIVLYFLAVGPVRGFAFTLGLSTALDLVLLYLFTRPAVQLIGQGRLLTRRSVHATTTAPEVS